jgi:hypothetical protein
MSSTRSFSFVKNAVPATEDLASVSADSKNYILCGVSLEQTTYKDKPAVRLTMPFTAIQDPQTEQLTDRNYMAWLPLDLGDGVIEVASELVKNAPAYARGFVGLTVRIVKSAQSMDYGGRARHRGFAARSGRRQTLAGLSDCRAAWLHQQAIRKRYGGDAGQSG